MSAPAVETDAAFDLCGPLPIGTTVLEASAGTGKTFTIAALAARYVAEGHATLPELMIVTFGRAATEELRERVRERLVAVERGLADPAAARAGPDDVLALLAGVGDDEVRVRRRRLAHALAHFDAATIATTHQFCQQMLAGLGIVGDTDPDAVFAENIDDVVTEVVDDFYVRKYAAPGAGDPAFDRATALTVGRAVVGDPEARIEPRDAPTGSAAATRFGFATAVRAEVERRKRTRRLFTYDDMLTRLHAALTDGRLGPAACARLRARYRVVLVDEFQDTDPVQWDILRAAFHRYASLTFIGDPKQAIYAFRGADVVSYLEASRSAGTRATLATNWRSDAPLVGALSRVLRGAALGDPRIRVLPVEASHAGRRLAGAPDDTPFRLRVVPRKGLRSYHGLPRVDAAREKVAGDLAADVAALLGAPTTWDGRALGPGDVAVLVRTNDQGVLVRDALGAAGVPAVLGGTSSVFATESADEWLTLLEALEQPGRAARVRAAALTCFVGRTAAELDAAPERVLTDTGGLLRRWASILRDRGVAALFEAVSSTTRPGPGSSAAGSPFAGSAAAGTRLPARLLATRDGERRLTDVRHVAQVLHAAAIESQLGPVALVEWLRLRITEARSPGRGAEARPERSRRLESDSDAVQVLTVHRCKGLEFPVVYVPFGWDRWTPEPTVALHHDADGRRVRAVGGPDDPRWLSAVGAHKAEEDGEDLRLLYVALTRAQSQVVAWWAPSENTGRSAIHRLLVGRPAAGEEPDPFVLVPDDEQALAVLSELGGDDVSVQTVGRQGAAPFWPAPETLPRLAAARFDRTLDLAWRRLSYSSLTAAAHDAGAHGPGSQPGVDGATPVGGGAAGESEPEGRTLDDEADLELASVPGHEAGHEPDLDLASPMAGLPVGATFGTLVHAVLEEADTTAPDLRAELVRRASEQLARRPTADLDAATLGAALEPAVRTPLGPLGGGRSLADVAPSDRLAELDFELPLAGGDRDTERSGAGPSDQAGALVTLAQVADLLRRHLPADDPLAAYPDRLAGPELAAQPLRGYLTGSVDAVLRWPGGRFTVVDYKTNWLGPVGPSGPDPLTAAHYTRPALVSAMSTAHYPLQALLYSVALHRFLRWRLRGYDPGRHLGGALYLFLRGMCGPDTPAVDGVPCGVFGWDVPPALVVELSDLLDGEGA